MTYESSWRPSSAYGSGDGGQGYLRDADANYHQPHEPTAPARLGLHDACWTRLMLFFMRWLPAPVITATLPSSSPIMCLL